MNILFFDIGSYTYQDILSCFKEMGHTCKVFLYTFPDMYHDPFFCERFRQELERTHYDIVFSINFFPLTALICHEKQIRYVSWSYDSPIAESAVSYFSYPTNYIFLFDRLEAEEYRQNGYSRVFYLPLAVNTARMDKIIKNDSFSGRYHTEVSFVGQLYQTDLDALLAPFSPYQQGYIEGILHAQLNIYGYSFLEELLPAQMPAEINAAFTKTEFLRRLQKHITFLERTRLLEAMGEHFLTELYSYDTYSFRSPVRCMGPVSYYTLMPCIFHTSKLNLCPVLRSIRSGIPLRALDIMASGGTLLSNYQTDLAEYFENNTDVIMYDSIEDAVDKAAFYLKNDTLREQLAQNAYEKVKKYFNYSQLLSTLFEIVSGN